MFSLEALQAKHGDALLLHYGPEDNPQMLMIDGGPPTVFAKTLLPRLAQIADFKGVDTLRARLVMVSHIDSDHIAGILDLMKHIDEDGAPFIDIQSLWHNSFDDSLDTAELGLLQSLGAISNTVAASMGLSHFTREVAAGVAQARTLRDRADNLGLFVNIGGGLEGFISEGDLINLGNGTTMRVINPDRGQLLGLRTKWDGLANRLRDLTEEQRRIVLARVVDDSLANISSIVFHIEKDGNTMLLTGDARADTIISGLNAAGLLPNGKASVDILKIPHHGSDRNVNTDFFRTVHAAHYIFSGDRQHSGSNPDKATFQMLTEAREDAAYTMYFTYDLPEIHEWIDEDQQSHTRNYEVFFTAEQEFGIWIDLEENLWF